jgi:hypothetical protein
MVLESSTSERVRGSTGRRATRAGWRTEPAATRPQPMAAHRIFKTSLASVYPLYVAKAEKKGRRRGEVDEIICWLTGYSTRELQAQLHGGADFETFFAEAPAMNPARAEITGTVCGVRVEEIEDPLMREIRTLDKLVDELAKGKAMDRILRG